MKTIRLFSAIAGILLVITGCQKEKNSSKEDGTLTLSVESLDFTGYASTLSVKVSANRSWKAVASEEFISVTPAEYPGADEMITANVTITVTDNETGQIRTGKVEFLLEGEKAAELTVTQKEQKDEDMPEDKFPVTWAHIQWAASEIIAINTQLDAGCKVYAPGLTNVEPGLSTTTGEGLKCEIGYSATSPEPTTEDWIWADCYFNGVWDKDAFDENGVCRGAFFFQGKTANIENAGKYYYSFRISNSNDTGRYYYAGDGGLWTGEKDESGAFINPVKSFEVKEPSAYDDVDFSALTCSWANLQWTNCNDNQITAGGEFEAGTCLFIDGFSNMAAAVTDPGNKISVQIGISTSSSNPAEGDWSWNDCWFNGDWGDNIYYQGKHADVPAGTYTYTFRIKIDGHQDYVYAGTNGIYDGVTNKCGTFIAK